MTNFFFFIEKYFVFYIIILIIYIILDILWLIFGLGLAGMEKRTTQYYIMLLGV